MISAIFGLCGSGKTTFLAYYAQRALRGKALRVGSTWLQDNATYDTVYSNTPISGTCKLDLSTVGMFAYKNSLILIDESVLLADSRDYKKLDKDLMMFFKQHRKYHSDIILASQGYKDMDLRIRDLYEQVLYCERWLFGCSRLSVVDKDISIDKNIDERYVLRGFLNRKTIRRKKYYPLFDTDYMHGRSLPDPPPPVLW